MASVSWSSGASGEWTVGANWDSGTEPGTSDDVFISVAGSYTVSLTAAVTVGSLTISDASATLQIQDPGGEDLVTGNLDSSGSVGVDALGSGGSTLTVGGTLTNGNYLQVGNSGMTTSALLTVGGTVGDTAATLTLEGGRIGAATQVAAAGEAPGTLTGTYNVVANAGGASLQWGSGGITQIGDGASNGGDLYIDGAAAFVEVGATNSNSGLDTLGTIAGNGLLDLRDGVTVATAGALTVDGGDGRLKIDAYGGSGGSDVTIGGDLTNSSAGSFGDGGVAVGGSGITVSDTLTVDGTVSNAGIVDVSGGHAGAAAQMLVTGAAPGTLTGTYNVVGDAGGAVLQFGSGGVTQIGDGASLGGDLYLDGSNAFAEIGATNSNSALTGLTTIAGNGLLDLRDGVTVITAGGLTVDGGDGRLKVDAYGGSGGSDVTIGGDLTNSSGGSFGDGGVAVGGSAITVADTLTVDGTVSNTGIVNVIGGHAGAAAQMLVTGMAPGTLTGTYNVVGDAGGAVLQFGNGGITQIGDGASLGGDLYIDGSNAFAEIGTTNSNSALTGLTTIAGNGLLDLRDGVDVTTAVGLTVDGGDGRLKVDAYGGGGGSDVTVGGDLTNSSGGSFGDGGVAVGGSGITVADTLTVDGTVSNAGIVNVIGGHAGAAAQMLVTGAAPGTLTGTYNVVGDAGGAVLQFGSGGVTQIGDGASLGGDLYIDGTNAFAEIGATNSNSVLTGLTTIAGNGLLDLRDGVTVSTSDSLTIDGGDGRLKVDAYGGSGGSEVTIGGDLTNSSAGSFGDGGVSVGGSGITVSDVLRVDGTVSNTGILDVSGGHTGAAALLLVTGAAPGTLTGTYNVAGGAGGAVLQFGSGGITQIGDGASLGGDLYIDGNNAFAEIGATNSNSALTGLTTIAGNGLLDLRDGVTVTTSGSLTVDGGDGRLKVDAYGSSGGGSDVTIGGDLTNGSFGNFSDGGVSVGNGNMSTGATLAVDGALNNTGGLVTLTGGRAGAAAQMTVAGAAPDTLTGQYNIVGGTGGASLQWGSGGITQIGDGAGNSGYLYLDGTNAFAEIGATNSNSALDTLGTIAGNGVLDLRDGITVTTSGSLTVDGGDGRLKVDAYGSSGGGSDVTIGGDLTNASFGNFSDGGVSVGNGNMSTGATLAVDGAFNNTGGLVALTGGRAGAAAQMTVADAAPGTLTGQYNIVGGTGGASLQWGSGAITQVGDGASNSGDLYIDGSNAFAEIGATSSNSALDTLSTIAGNGIVDLRDGVTVTTSGSLTVDGGDGRLKVDAYGSSGGGSDVTIGGDLTNGSFGNFSDGGVAVGNGNMSTGATLTVDGAFNNTGGLVALTGGRAGAAAQMTVGAAAPGTLTGQYNIVADAGGASLQWGSGGITQVGDGASNGSDLYIDGATAYAEIGATNSNSALDTLGTIAGNGLVDLRDGATVATSGSLTVDGGDGRLKVDAYGSGGGASDVTIGGDLVNGSAGNFSDGGVAVGNSQMTHSDLLTVDGTLVNNVGAIVTADGNANDGGAGQAVIDAGAVTNAGAVNVLANAVLEVAAGNTYTQNGGNTFISGTLVADSVALNGGVIDLSTGQLDATALSIAAGSSLIGFGTVAATITSTGSIEASGGSLDLAGGLAAPAALAIENSSALELAGTDSGNVTFAGSSGIFELDDPIGFTGTIDGLAIDDTLVLRNTQATGAVATYDAGTDTSTLAISLAGGGTLDFTLAGNYAGEAFGANPVGNDTQIAAVGAAVGEINTPVPIAIGTIRQGAPATVPLSITNNAPTGSAALDVSIGALSGGATASGTIIALAPGATDATDITVGVGNGAAGVQTGTVTLDFASDLAGGNTAPLPTEAVVVSGTVYREALAAITPLTLYAHVGDPGVETLDVSNIAQADGYSEALIAALTGATGGFTVTGAGPTGDIVAGGSDAVSLTLDYSTAQAGMVSGNAVVALTSDGGTGVGSIDGLGTISLGTETVPISVSIDNFATAAIQTPTDFGTLSSIGNSATLDLGTIAENTGSLDINLGVTNAANPASGPADLLSGSFVATPANGFALTSLGAFSGLAAGQAASGVVTLDTGVGGVVSQTITLEPIDSAGTFSESLAPQTLTITGTVEPLPPPTITAAATLSAMSAVPTLVGVTIADPNTDTLPLTVTVSDSGGDLTAITAGAATVTGNGSNMLTLTGDVTDINEELETLAYTNASVGADTIEVTVEDQHHASAAQSITMNVGPVPFTTPVINGPTSVHLIAGTATGIGGINLSDPSAEASGTPVTFELQSPNAVFTVTGPDGPTITGQGTGDLTITGTVQQINDDFSDGAKAAFAAAVLGLYGFATISLTAVTAAASVSNPESAVEIQIEAQEVQEKINEVVEQIGEAYKKASEAEEALDSTTETSIGLELGDAHITTFSGNMYDFNASGEFVLAKSTNSGDTFQLQVRLQPYANSPSGTVITQLGALVGTDRVTFGLDRTDTVWVNGSPEALAVGGSVKLSGGQLTAVAANTYTINWNTGEVLTVIDNGTYLDTQVGLGGGQGPGSMEGLMGPDEGQANDFMLPDGTVLAQPLTTDQLYNTFGAAWQVTAADSLLDYATGQSAASFPLTPPVAPLTLDDLPADAVAAAAQLVAAAGITNPAAAAAAEYDYLVTGNTNFVGSDAAGTQTVTTTEANATPSSTPVALGVYATEAQVAESPTAVTPVTFNIYLTGTTTTPTTVDWSVIAPDPTNDFLAAALGGTFPSGTAILPAGQTTGTITVDLPVGAIGSATSANLVVQVSDENDLPVFGATAETLVTGPTPGAPPVPELQYLGTLGTFTRSGNDYTLDLGAVQLSQVLPQLQFAVVNGATAPADQLGGTFDVEPVTGFDVSGDSLPSPINPGASYGGVEVTANEDKFGDNTETITFNPVDTNSSGFSASLQPITLTIADTLEMPSMVYSEAWGDVHIITYNSLDYNFQQVGEFILAQSRIPGDNFEIQMRLQPYFDGASVSVITQVAIQLGADSVTFDWTRTDPVWVDGVQSSISQADPTLIMSGGTITEISPTLFKVDWNTGETMTVTNGGVYDNIVDGIPGTAAPGSYGGLQGEDEGQSNDFQLADGTVLQQPLSTSTLYGEYANSWRVSQQTSLFNYPTGETTANFTDTNFPADAVSLADLPQNLVDQAAAMVAAAGIVDPGIAQEAELDYLATGNPSFITTAETIQEETTPTTAATVTPPAVVPALGVMAVTQTVTTAATGVTPVTFDAYLTGTLSSDTIVNYAVVATGTGFLGAASFGGTLPSGQVTITAGQTIAPITINVPQGALAGSPSDDLEVQISDSTGISVFAPSAQSEIVSDVATPGNPAIPELTELNGGGTLSFDAITNSYTLDLGNVVQGSAHSPVVMAIVNAATAPADLVGGAFTAPLGSGFTVTGDDLTSPVPAGQISTGIVFTVKTAQPDANSITLGFDPEDVNDTGYVGTLSPITLTIEDTVVAPGVGQLNTPQTIVFPNVHVGTPESVGLSVSNTGSAPIAVSVSAADPIIAEGTIASLAPGATDKTDLSVGVDTSSAGALSGAVEVNFGASDPAVDTFGDVFRLASGTIAPVTDFVHVGDPGTIAVDISNTATADGFSENLLASLASVTGDIGIAAAGPTGEIAAGSSDTSSLLLDFSTAHTGTLTGTATVDLTSDGGTGAGSIDGLGTTALGSQVTPVTIMVDSFAKPVFEEVSAQGTFAQNGTAYTLDLGAIQQNSTPLEVNLGVLNDVAGPADVASGTLLVSGSSAFTNSGLDPFTGLAAEQADVLPMVTLATGTTGTFSETITLAATGSNPSGFSDVLPSETLTVTGTVVAGAGGIGSPGSASLAGTLANIGVVDETPLTPFAGLTVIDTGDGDTDTVTIALANPAFGTLSNLDGGSYDSTTGVYSITGAPDAVTAAMDGLELTPAAPAADVYLTSTPVTVSLVGSAGGSATQGAIDASVQQVLGLASVPVGDVVISVSGDGTGLAAPVDGDTNEAAVTDATASATYFLPTGYQAEYLGGDANATLEDIDVGSAVLVGNTGNDVLIGGAANDSIVAGDGNNTLGGGSGTTALVVGDGNDSITTVADSTYTVSLGGGTDTVFANGSGTVTGGTGSDLVDASGTGPSVTDIIVLQGLQGSVLGGAGGLTVLDDGAQDTIQGGSGATSVTLDGSLDRTRGGSGDFSVLDQTASNTVIGGTAGLSAVTIGAANTTMFGRAGNTAIVDLATGALIGAGGGTGAVTIGGANAQVYGSYNGTGTLNASIGAANAIVAIGAANATVDGTSSLATGALVFGGFSNTPSADGSLLFNGGADQVFVITGGSNATVNAGTGETFVYIGTGTIAGSTVIDGSSSPLDVTFIGGGGSTTVFAGTGATTLFGVDGTDATFISTVAGAQGGLLVADGTAAGSETIDAAASTTNDTLSAAKGNVSLVAGTGNDILEAGGNTGSLGGAGTVVGGDTMVAGSGSDVMVFAHGTFAGAAVVINFNSADNVFLGGYDTLAGGAAGSDTQAIRALKNATTVGGDTTIALADGTTITFVDTTTAQLQAHLFSG